jgi:hypothetical protein
MASSTKRSPPLPPWYASGFCPDEPAVVVHGRFGPGSIASVRRGGHIGGHRSIAGMAHHVLVERRNRRQKILV